jgi:hypothetical protein
VGLEQGPLSLVNTIEDLLGRNSSGSGLENREYGRRDPPLRPLYTLYPQKLAVASPTSGGRSIGIVRSRTKATEFSLVFSCYFFYLYHISRIVVKISRISLLLLVCFMRRGNIASSCTQISQDCQYTHVFWFRIYFYKIFSMFVWD